jgi:hypothetical protein
MTAPKPPLASAGKPRRHSGNGRIVYKDGNDNVGEVWCGACQTWMKPDLWNKPCPSTKERRKAERRATPPAAEPAALERGYVCECGFACEGEMAADAHHAMTGHTFAVSTTPSSTHAGNLNVYPKVEVTRKIIGKVMRAGLQPLPGARG